MTRKRSQALWAVAALLAANLVLILAQPGLAITGALPGSLAGYHIGPKLVRAAGLVKDRPEGTITLRERDGSVVTIPVAPGATVTLRGRTVALSALRRGMTATVIRDGDAPATEIRAGG
jgi:hypothetical protein